MNVEIIDKPMKPSAVHLVECPRDAMQGWKDMISTEQKVRYLNALLQVGFDTIDFGSFVSPKAVPQMADTKEVLGKIQLNGSRSGLLAIVANVRGAEEACQFDAISYLGFPFSVSPTFQQKNTNSTIEESLKVVDQIRDLCMQHKKEPVVYLSMGFGNPYGDPYSEDILLRWADEMVAKDIRIISLADTVGLATADQVYAALNALNLKYPDITFGAHLHSTDANWREKLQAAVDAGCRRIDGALKGIGGCHMAGNDLVGNMRMEWIIDYMEEKPFVNFINREALQNAMAIADEIFGQAK